MSDERNQIAQEKYGKDFEELDATQRQSVGGTIGGQHRKEQMAAEHGGDESVGYKEMGQKGGSQNKQDDDKA